MSEPVRMALAGNPNSGKTTIFNALTGSRQHVGNYPGVTVEKKEGTAFCGERQVLVVDLPGTYTLSAQSLEEIVARNFIIDEHPGVVVAIVDASNLERNLYLAVQLMELGVPLVIALNMMDVAQEKGLNIDIPLLSSLLGLPVVATVGSKGQGIRELLETAVHLSDHPPAPEDQEGEMRRVDYGSELDPHVRALEERISRHASLDNRSRWYAVKLIEGDEVTHRRVQALCPEGAGDLLREAARMRSHIEAIYGDEASVALADRRYGYVAGLVAEVVSRTQESRLSRSEHIDCVVLNRWLGLPLFAAMMYAVFQLTFTVAEPLMLVMEWLFGLLAQGVAACWPAGSESLWKSLAVDGVIGGVGGVLVFLPSILLLFAAIALLEDSGYMARAAFLMDRLMHKIGLHGKSFIPMLIGFGCTVPAIMATRTLESRRDRLTTMLVLPLMSCGARLPIYGLFIPAFFPEAWRGPVLWMIYVSGILLAILAARLLRSTLFRGDMTSFVMELPPYRAPTWRGLARHMLERTWLFVRKAGTLILGASVALWMLSTWPTLPPPQQQALDEERAALFERSVPAEERAEALRDLDSREAESRLTHSAMGRIGHAIAPVFRPAGFDWKIATALIGAFAAKEVFVAQLGVVNSVGAAGEDDEHLRDKLRRQYTPLQGLCVMLFCLIGMPCMATVAVTKRESGRWKWALLQLGGLTLLAWIVTVAVYQVGSLLGF